MGSNFLRLGDVSLKIGSGATPRGGKDVYLDKGDISLIRSQNIYNFYFDYSGITFITEEHARQLTNVSVQANDVLLNITGDSVARVCQVPLDVLPARVNQHVAIIRPDPEILDPRFLCYFLSSPKMQHHMLGLASSGGTRNALTKGMIEDFEIPAFDTDTQKAIAAVLGALDDKIELNRRMNETLEAMAKALFKSWFVDFDPVRAKAKQRQDEPLTEADQAILSSLAPDLLALFPDSFQDSDLGEIPSGWEVKELGDFCKVIDCLHSKKPKRQDFGKPLLQLNNIRDDGLLDMSDIYFVSDDDYEKWISRIEASKGDCVVTNVGRVGAFAQIPPNFKGALGRNMTAVRLKDNYPYPTFLIQYFSSDLYKREMQLKIDTGTILDALNVKNIPKLRTTFSSFSIVENFELIARPIRSKMEKLLFESQTLTNTRDTLLPKLISGELTVRDAESLVGAV